jgi:hypothetical protein
VAVIGGSLAAKVGRPTGRVPPQRVMIRASAVA